MVLRVFGAFFVYIDEATVCVRYSRVLRVWGSYKVLKVHNVLRVLQGLKGLKCLYGLRSIKGLICFKGP